MLTVLIHLGYLAYDDEKEEAYVPNEEVRSALKRAIAGISYDKDDPEKKHSCVIGEWEKED